MQYLLDCANAAKVAEVMEYFPIVGVTTNPTFVTREQAEFLPLMDALHAVVGKKMFFVQVLSHTAEDIVREALALQAHFGEPFYAKIPVSPDGLRAIRILREKGCKTLGTAVFTPQQALLCARSGASFVAPYVCRLDAIGGNGVEMVANIVDTLLNANVETEVLAAGLKTVPQVESCALAGAGYATMTPDLFYALAHHPLTDAAVEIFDDNWHAQYGQTTTLDFLK